MKLTHIHSSYVALLLFIGAFTSTWHLAQSHGFLLQPMGRSFVSYKFDPPETRNFNPQGANAGGKARVYDNGRLRWPNGRFGLCGDPWDAPQQELAQPGSITATFRPGTTITIHLVITANHWGRMEFNLCPINATAADFKQGCQQLQRADGKGPHWTLPPGELPDPQGRPLVPAFQDGSFNYYIYPENDDFRDTPVFVVQYRLPSDFECEHCVLQWYWLTGNSCNPPCETSDPLYPECNRLQMGFCGDGKALPPEEFWGCSDVRVAARSAPGPVINSSLEGLSDRLQAAQQAQDNTDRADAPQRPRETYWRAELLQQAEQLDAHAGHKAQHSRTSRRHSGWAASAGSMGAPADPPASLPAGSGAAAPVHV